MLTQTELNDKQLRYFGLSLGALFLVFAAVAYWKFEAQWVAGILCGGACVLTGIYYAVPGTRRQIYRGFRFITYPIQLVMTTIVLGIVYYLLVTPLGWALRLKGVNVRKKSDSESLWSTREDENEPSRYFKTY